MSNSQERTENLLRQRYSERKPRIERALAKLVRKLKNKEQFIANAEMRARRTVDAMERMVVTYEEDLEIIAQGSYRGYNGLPFGFVSGLEGVDE